jgi:hypothetical protein
MGVKATFDMIDASRSGNVSAGELARTLRKMHVIIEEASAQELIFSINARHGSKRKSLTFDIFAVAFGANSPASTAAALSPEISPEISLGRSGEHARRGPSTVRAAAAFVRKVSFGKPRAAPPPASITQTL